MGKTPVNSSLNPWWWLGSDVQEKIPFADTFAQASEGTFFKLFVATNAPPLPAAYIRHKASLKVSQSEDDDLMAKVSTGC